MNSSKTTIALVAIFIYFSACLQICFLSASAENIAVPSVEYVPSAPIKDFGMPVVNATKIDAGERIVLSNDVVKVTLFIDNKRHIQIVSLCGRSGAELLNAPVNCLQIVDADDTVLKEGSEMSVENWYMWQYGSHCEIEIRIRAKASEDIIAGEKVVWRLRLYRLKPYLEQLFEVPEAWREPDNALRQILPVASTLKPVMPNNIMKLGFSDGRPNLDSRHRFEFVKQSDHLGYDENQKVGLAAFVAGIGGEERVSSEEMMLLDHVTTQFGASEPVARFILWPFDGPVEHGFMGIRRFVSDEVSCQGDKTRLDGWTQLWLWQAPITSENEFHKEQVTAERILDILPHLKAMGYEWFHLDAGWPIVWGDWRFDPKRFPDGFEPIRQALNSYGIRYSTWMNDLNTESVLRLCNETNLSLLFGDASLSEDVIKVLREVREEYPDLQFFPHNSSSRSKNYKWGNIHFLREFNHIYFGEAYWGGWTNILPDTSNELDMEKYMADFTFGSPKPISESTYKAQASHASRHSVKAGDLVTRSAAYQVHWAWPFKTIHPPHDSLTWWKDRPVGELADRIYTTIAARYNYQWGDDPRVMSREYLKLFRDATAFFKATRLYTQEYQHVLPQPDGLNPDGVAHLKDGSGFIFLFNPGGFASHVSYKELLWEPELELDPSIPILISDWTDPLDPEELDTIDLAKPQGGVALRPFNYSVIGINVEIEKTLAAVKYERDKINWKPVKVEK